MATSLIHLAVELVTGPVDRQVVALEVFRALTGVRNDSGDLAEGIADGCVALGRTNADARAALGLLVGVGDDINRAIAVATAPQSVRDALAKQLAALGIAVSAQPEPLTRAMGALDDVARSVARDLAEALEDLPLGDPRAKVVAKKSRRSSTPKARDAEFAGELDGQEALPVDDPAQLDAVFTR